MIISFAWTAPALLAGEKTVTRRAWSQGHARRFHAGDVVDAYDRAPFRGGRRIAQVRLLRDPYREHTFDMPESDRAAEGFRWIERHGDETARERAAAIWREWREAGHVLWVVRFELERVLPAAASCDAVDSADTFRAPWKSAGSLASGSPASRRGC